MKLDKLRTAFQHEGEFSRRLFLAYAASLASIPSAGQCASAAPRHSFTSDPFTCGVASGDPDHQSVVLWTRLAPKPLEPGGGMPNTPVTVHWELAADSAFKTITQSGKIHATPALGHSVHVEPVGLESNRWYFYRFQSGGATSPIGRTRTLPAPADSPEKIRFAVTSCQNYEQGLFTAYQQMAADDPDLVFHLGDYIYEYSGVDGRVRKHYGPEIETLDQYRSRYAQYRGDKDLQKMHATCPWFVTWDDHEFDNNCANAISEEKHVKPENFLIRRANAYQAYYEMMPLRRSSLPVGPKMTLYRNAHFGTLADFFVLDTRQYRTDQPNNDRKSPVNRAALDPRNTLLGLDQRKWLFESLSSSATTWNILAQQVMMALADRARPNSPAVYSMDQWPGYAHERQLLLKHLHDHKINNPVVLTGDIHSNWANELRVNDFKPEEDIVATEFVTTSLSSGGNGSSKTDGLNEFLARNPCTKFFNRERGYVLCDVTPKTYTADFKVIDDVLRPGGTTASRARFTVEAGIPKIQRA